MLIRAIMVLEGLGRSLDPNYQIVESLEPYIRKLIADKMSIKRLGMGAMRTVTSLSTLAQRLPNRLDDLWDQIDEGNLSIGVSVRDLTYHHWQSRPDRQPRRLCPHCRRADHWLGTDPDGGRRGPAPCSPSPLSTSACPSPRSVLSLPVWPARGCCGPSSAQKGSRFLPLPTL